MKQPFRFEGSASEFGNRLILDTGEMFHLPNWVTSVHFIGNGDIWAIERGYQYEDEFGLCRRLHIGKLSEKWYGDNTVVSVNVSQFIAAQNLECGGGKTSVAHSDDQTSGICKIENMPIGATITGICNGECGMEYFRIKPERYEIHDDIITILCGNAASGRSRGDYGLELNIKRGTNVKYEV